MRGTCHEPTGTKRPRPSWFKCEAVSTTGTAVVTGETAVVRYRLQSTSAETSTDYRCTVLSICVLPLVQLASLLRLLSSFASSALSLRRSALLLCSARRCLARCLASRSRASGQPYLVRLHSALKVAHVRRGQRQRCFLHCHSLEMTSRKAPSAQFCARSTPSHAWTSGSLS